MDEKDLKRLDEKDLERLKDILLRQRLEIYDRLQGLESEWETLSERDIEIEEEAQKADLTALFGQLDELEKQEIEEIDLALTKMAAATYGTCEMCRNAISRKRLQAIPAARFCKRCAQKAEAKTRP